ncbi:ras-like protein [Anaeramoeba ignava]|uniref:Ras-like protein n=1 Tax=Anaeramoeba ignava TaxID=1746090 RepID=A0A9Q0R7H7_ANAIG|nr:ras-like protein [Anaeramoeba ignava]
MPNFKVVIIGIGGVGKSALTLQFVHRKFVDAYEPTIEDIYRRQIELDDEVYVLDLLDTAGQEEFSVIHDTHLRSGDGFIIVFSLVDRESYESVPNLISQIYKVKETDKFPIVIVGNKSDLEKDRCVDFVEAEKFAKQKNSRYFETSAKLRTNVEDPFHFLAREMNRISLNPQSVLPERKKKFCSIL